MCWCVLFSPPYDRVLQCGVTRASGLCFFPFVQGKFFKSRTKNQHRCAFCPIDPLFPLPHQRLLDAVVLNPATLHLSLSLAASAASASRLPRGPCQGVRAVKNQPLPQTLTSKSIRVPFSDQFVKAPLGSRGPERVYVCVHPKISRFSRVTQTVQHLIQHRQPHPDTDLANCVLSGLTSF